MNKNLILFFAVVLPAQLFPQPARKPLISSYTSFGYYSTKQQDVFSFSGNQSSLAMMTKPAAGVYADKKFMLNGLSFYKMAVAVPSVYGNAGLNMNYSGSAAMNEANIGFAFARKLAEKMSLGLQFNYYNLKVAGYGSAASVNAELGSLIQLTDKLNAGVHIYNPFRSRIGKLKDERLVAAYSFGLGYDVSEQFFISAEIQKNEGEPVNINSGFQYHILPVLFFRAGINTNTAEFYFGTGIYLKDFRIDIAGSFHQQLGITPGLSLIYEIKKADQ